MEKWYQLSATRWLFAYSSITRSWHDMERRRCKTQLLLQLSSSNANNCYDDNNNDTSQSIINAYPCALEIIHGKTRLMPFMIAALPHHNSSNELNEELKIDNNNDDEHDNGCTKQLHQLSLKASNAIALSLCSDLTLNKYK